MSELHAVTGAFGYTGKYIAQRLLARGHHVITLTNSPHKPDPFHGQVRTYPFHWDQPDRLVATLRGVSVLYNTYWVRFNYKTFTFDQAVRNSRTLFEAARRAGVERIVHTSILNPSLDSPYGYYRGKAQVEEALKSTGISYAILRPGVIFGPEDILINNIAWALRRFPIIGVFGDGHYRLQPIYVEDFADLALAQGEARENVIIDAIGPETFTYRELVRTLGEIIGKPRPIISVPPRLGYMVAWAIGKWQRDVFLTWEEVQALMDDLLYADGPPAGTTRLTDWARAHAHELGRAYASELGRRK